MTTLKKIFAAATAVASVGVLTMASIPADAAVVIPYNGPSTYSLMANDDGSTARVNILNVWMGQDKLVEDIAAATTVVGYVEVDFTVSGLNGRTCNMNEDGSEGAAYTANLNGQIAGVAVWGDNSPTAITGDGSYTVRWDLTMDSDSIEALILSTNINFYQLGESVTGIADSGLNITIDEIRTGEAEGGEGEGSGDTTTTTTTGNGGGSDTTTTTTKKNSSSSGSSSNKTNSSNKTSNSTTSTVTKTADAGVVAIVVGAAAAASLAVGTMTYKRKNK